jgi:hypothetical protein
LQESARAADIPEEQHSRMLEGQQTQSADSLINRFICGCAFLLWSFDEKPV